jgi:1-acyl-sn-glycerol-3-phosphate acyltransferase
MGTAEKITRILYKFYTWLIFVPLFVAATCFFVLLGVLAVIFFDDRTANRTTGVWWARFASIITPMFVTVIGRGNIEKNTPYIVVANHQSHYDIFVLYGWLGLDLKWVIKKELRKIPVFGFAGEMGGNIFIDRSNPKTAYASLAEARSKIERGSSIIMLPEGTRSNTGELGEFKKGAFILSLDLGIPVLPVTIINTEKILPARSFDLFPGRATMKIHKPVFPAAYTHEKIDAFIKDVRDTIRDGLKKN